ncbi:unnamed protein product [Blepharisma stoltei]|uniref:RING-type domain-containing protein n=1 Tax=Blepharisma stoltei TaxID=1481888 RepID=A0AAU9IQ87_9CILI|nr:unnamed protein product [Blepharisma stoltei]
MLTGDCRNDLKAVIGFSKGLPPQAIYLAGIVHNKASLSLSEIFNFLRILYQKSETHEISLDLRERIEENLYIGEVETAMKIFNSFLTSDIPFPKRKNQETKRSVQEQAEAQYKSVEKEALDLLDMMRALDSVPETDLIRNQSALECSLCTNDMSYNECSVLENCPHMFHKACIEDYFHMQVLNGITEIKCPNSSCKKDISMNDLTMLLSREDLEKYEENGVMKLIEGELMTCPNGQCKEKFEKPQNQEEFICPSCRKKICGVCKRLLDVCACIRTDPGNKPAINAPPAYVSLKCKNCNAMNKVENLNQNYKCRCGQSYCTACMKPEQECQCHNVRGRRPGAVL